MRTLGPEPSPPSSPHRAPRRRRSRSPAPVDVGPRTGVSDPSHFVAAVAAILAGNRSRRSRRLVAATLAALAVLALTAGIARPQDTTTAVLVMSRDVAASTVIAADDITLGPWPSGLPTTGLLTDPTAAIGERAAIPLSKGSPLTATALMGPSLLKEAGLVLAPIRIDDSGAADLVSAGDHVDVLAAPDSGSPEVDPSSPATAVVVASDARVVATPARPAASSSSSFLGGGSASGGSGTILLALDRTTAARVAAASAASRLSLVVRAR